MDKKLESALGDLQKKVENPPHPLRKPCVHCGETRGRIVTTNGQDVLRCLNGHFQYNAPRTETGRETRSLQSIRHTPPSQWYRLLERAHGRCELCARTEKLTVDHILPVKHGFDFITDAKLESDDNKMVLCAECNSGKKHRIPPAWLVAAILYLRSQDVS